MVRPLPVRSEEPPDDTVVVIRAGVMGRGNLLNSAQKAQRVFGVYAVSVEAVLAGSIEDTCRESPRIGRRYGRIRLSSFGRLRREGFALVATFDRPHYTVVLPDMSETTTGRLEACFDPPIANPARERKG